MAFDAALLADPAITLADGLARARRVKRHSVVLTSLS
jgi:hypothetical protein